MDFTGYTRCTSSNFYYDAGASREISPSRQLSKTSASVLTAPSPKHKMEVDPCEHYDRILPIPWRSPHSDLYSISTRQPLPSLPELMQLQDAETRQSNGILHHNYHPDMVNFPHFTNNHSKMDGSISSPDSTSDAMSLDDQDPAPPINTSKTKKQPAPPLPTSTKRRSPAPPSRTAATSGSETHRRGEKERRRSTSILGDDLLAIIPPQWRIICDRIAPEICSSRTNTGKEPARHVVSFYARTLIEYFSATLDLGLLLRVAACVRAASADTAIAGAVDAEEAAREEAANGVIFLKNGEVAKQIIRSRCHAFQTKKKSTPHALSRGTAAAAGAGTAAGSEHAKQPKDGRSRVRGSTGYPPPSQTAGSRSVAKL